MYEAAGGREGLLRLAGAWHSRVMADDIVPAISHGSTRSIRRAADLGQALPADPLTGYANADCIEQRARTSSANTSAHCPRPPCVA